MATRARTLGLYVHAPFCVHKCGYCDFNSWAETRREPMERWLAAFERQAAFWGARSREAGYRVETVFFGGGTPSLLPNDLIEAAGLSLRRNFDPVDDWPELEWTVECNPETLDAEKLHSLRSAGATRLSVGLQSFHDASLERLERRARREHNLRALELVVKEWGGPWSGDLMYGLPDQSSEAWREDLEQLLNFEPPHVSAYQLTLSTERSKNWSQPPEDTLLAMFDATEALCREAGLVRYEVSNFARSGAECRHNLRYWRLEPFVGLGPGAAGLLPPALLRKLPKPEAFGWHQRGPESFEAWEAMAGSDQEIQSLKARSPLEHAEEILLMGLRLPEGVELGRFGPAAPIFKEALKKPPFQGFLEYANSSQATGNTCKVIRANTSGYRVLDSILPKIYELLDRSKKLSGPELDLTHFDPNFSGMSEFTENPSNFKDEKPNQATDETANGAEGKATGPAENASNEPASTDASTAPEGSTDDDASLTEWKNKVAYLAAEIENMRKRFMREKSEVVKFANEELVKVLLPVVDNLAYAVKAAKDAESKLDASIRENPVVTNLFKGVDMTLKHFESTLEQIGVKPVPADGQPFDPVHHEAVGQANDGAYKDNYVVSVMQRGWTLFGRVIRPARVIVNKFSS